LDEVERIGSAPAGIATVILVAVPQRHAHDTRPNGRIDHRLDFNGTDRRLGAKPITIPNA
jgi:hypothetical protein